MQQVSGIENVQLIHDLEYVDSFTLQAATSF